MAAEMVDDGEMGGGLSRGVLLGQREREPQKKISKGGRRLGFFSEDQNSKPQSRGFSQFFKGGRRLPLFFF
jgi:hypothetical protein